jgi:tyrosyl-tRNA synthetase
MVGDPSGKRSERPILPLDQIDRNAQAIRAQLARFLSFEGGGSNSARLRNNADWLRDLPLMDFLREAGRHLTLGFMLQKDSVRSRLESGISYTEFSYMAIQAYDFWHLFRTEGCELQVGGGDQWGNITAGIELVRKREGQQLHGLVFPLITNASGAKFGKSEGGDSVWLDPERTSPYAFYQYWLNTDDRDVGTYLRWFTELGREEIEALEAEAARAPEARAAQRVLARDITARTHGEAAATQAISDSAARFATGPIDDPAVLRSLFEGSGGFTFTAHRLAAGVAVLLAEAGVFPSRGDARRTIAGGGVTVNGTRVTDPSFVPEPVAGEWLDVRIGKRRREIGRRAG